LYSQGQDCRKIALILTGSVKITQIGPAGSEVLLWMLGAGNVIESFTDRISSCHRNSARTMEDSTMLTWDRMQFCELTNRYPRIEANRKQILVDRLIELEDRFREVATEPAERRIALVLLRLVKEIGKRKAAATEVGLTRAELAQMTGTTLFTVSRMFSRWSEAGLVVPRREGVSVCDVSGLEVVANEQGG
jgi:CRP-like cAMP-binding protein